MVKAQQLFFFLGRKRSEAEKHPKNQNQTKQSFQRYFAAFVSIWQTKKRNKGVTHVIVFVDFFDAAVLVLVYKGHRFLVNLQDSWRGFSLLLRLVRRSCSGPVVVAHFPVRQVDELQRRQRRGASVRLFRRRRVPLRLERLAFLQLAGILRRKKRKNLNRLRIIKTVGLMGCVPSRRGGRLCRRCFCS